VLVPLLPFSLEMLALRRMRIAAFGTLMALEPGIAVLIGLLLLAQLPASWQVAGVALVVAAGIGAQRTAPATRVAQAANAGESANAGGRSAARPDDGPGRRRRPAATGSAVMAEAES
jgi:inner membrane transporter RhtA